MNFYGSYFSSIWKNISKKFQRNNLLEEVNGLICQKKYLLKLLLVQQLTSLPLITCLVLLNLFFKYFMR